MIREIDRQPSRPSMPSIMALAVLVASANASALDAAEIGPLTVSPPHGPAWERVKQTSTSVAYRLLAKGDLRAAMASTVDLQKEIPSDAALTQEARRLVKAATTSQYGANAKLTQQTYSSTKHAGYRCTKAVTATEVQPPSGVAAPPQTVQAQYLFCSLPELKGRAGYILAFSYVSPIKVGEREVEAEQFFRGAARKR